MLPLLIQMAWAAPLSVHSEHSEMALMAPETESPAPPWPEEDIQPTDWVYGYLPHWSNGPNEVPWSTMTHVAWFDVVLQADGDLEQLESWERVAPELIELATDFGVKIHLTVSCFEPEVLESVLTDRGLRLHVARRLARLVESAGAHGVNVDFERLPGALADEFVEFVAELSREVDEVVVATPTVDWEHAYDLEALSSHVEAFFLMGYNYHHAHGDPGPNAPLNGGGVWPIWSLEFSVQDHISRGVPREKIVLGLPLYGHRWPTRSTTVPGTATGSAAALSMAEAVSEAERHGAHWDTQTATPYAFPSDTSQVWYDDPDSLMEKVRWAQSKQLAGVGFWAIGYTHWDSPLWSNLKREMSREAPGDSEVELSSASAAQPSACSNAPGGALFGWWLAPLVLFRRRLRTAA